MINKFFIFIFDLVLIFIYVILKYLSNGGKVKSEPLTLFDFTSKDADLSKWTEQSDPVREVGMSKACFVLQTTQIFQRGIFFTLLNPQPNGACFAGSRISVQLDLSSCTKLKLKLRGQGSNSGYKVILRHKGQNEEPHPSYENMFQAPMNKFEEVTLSLSNFEPYYRGKKMDPSIVGNLDLANITNFEFQVYGGVYLPVKQAGVSSLEIDWVQAL